MSWTSHKRILPSDQLDQAIGEMEPSGNDSAEMERNQQFYGAQRAALDLMRSCRTLAPAEDHGFIVTMSGHANAGGIVPSGVSPDYITVTVSRANKPVEDVPPSA